MADSTVNIELDALVGLAIEHWRLSSALGARQPAAVNYALRKMGDFFKTCELEIRSLDGQPYDAGLAARVIETVDADANAEHEAIIVQTLSPMVLYRGSVVRPAEIVIASKAHAQGK